MSKEHVLLCSRVFHIKTWSNQILKLYHTLLWTKRKCLFFQFVLLFVVVAFPIFGVACGPVICFPHCTHLLQSAQLRLRRTVCQCVLSACFRTPRLSLGHPGSLTSVHDLKCMRTQTAPLFNAPRGRRGNRAQVSFPRIHPVTWTGVEPTTLGLWVRRAIH